MEDDDSVSEDYKRIRSNNQILYLICSFTWGISTISELAIQFFFKDELGVEPDLLLQINSLISFPWTLKPLYGLLSDLFPFYGYRRKSYLIMFGTIMIICWLLMAFYTKTIIQTTIILFVRNFCLAFISVLAESMVVELTQLETSNLDSKSKDYVSSFFFVKHLGSLITSYLKGVFVDIFALRKIFLIDAFVPIGFIIVGFLYIEAKKENSLHKNPSYNSEDKEQYEKKLEKDHEFDLSKKRNEAIRDLLNFIKKKHVYVPFLMIVLFSASPNYNDPFFYFLTNQLKIKATVLGELSFVGNISMLVGIIFYKTYLKNVGFQKMIIFGTIFSTFISLFNFLLVLRVNINFGISDLSVLFLTGAIISFLAEFIIMPVQALACASCPKNLEGTVYSIFMSAIHFGFVFSRLSGAIISKILNITSKDYSKLHLLIFISKVCTLIPLPLLCCLDDSYFSMEKPKVKIDDKDEKSDLIKCDISEISNDADINQI